MIGPIRRSGGCGRSPILIERFVAVTRWIDDRDRDRAEAIERDLELIEAVEVQAVCGQHRGAEARDP